MIIFQRERYFEIFQNQILSTPLNVDSFHDENSKF